MKLRKEKKKVCKKKGKIRREKTDKENEGVIPCTFHITEHQIKQNVKKVGKGIFSPEQACQYKHTYIAYILHHDET